MIRIISILLIFMLMICPCYAADTNWVVGSTNSGSTSGDDSIEGTPPNMFDENDATAYGSGESSAVTTIGTSEFAAGHSVNRIRLSDATLYPSSTATYLIEAYYSGGWHTIGSGSVDANPDVVDLTGLTLTNVSKVRATAVDAGFDTGYGWIAASYIKEISAWGTDPAGYAIIY